MYVSTKNSPVLDDQTKIKMMNKISYHNCMNDTIQSSVLFEALNNTLVM